MQGRIRVLLSKGQNGVVLFEHRQFPVHQGQAHHRAAHEQASRLMLEASGEGQHFLDGGADGDPHVLGMGYGGAVHGQAAGNQRPCRS